MDENIPSKEEILKKKCVPCEGKTKPLNMVMIKGYLSQIAGWEYDGKEISKTFPFQNFHETMAFVNKVAELSHREDHHPDLEVSYKACKVKYHTHAINGMSTNDFICAAKVDEMLKQ